MLYNLDEICLIPSTITNINSRSQCDPYIPDSTLPIFVAPMASLVDENNYTKFSQEGLHPIIPRSVDFETRKKLLEEEQIVAFGYRETEKLLEEFSISKPKSIPRICIDQANGHMKSLLNLCEKLKNLLGQQGVWIITGNIANPATYYEYAKVGVDAIRVGIGSGSVCTTSLQTGIHYPMASLIHECNLAKKFLQNSFDVDIDELKRNNVDKSIIEVNENIRCEYKSVPLIIADGGFNKIDQIIKALAIGADCVMLGEMISHMDEACGEKFSQWVSGELITFRNYYGMSTTEAQKIINNNSISPSDSIKVSEGICKRVEVNTNLNAFKKAFIHALKSTMSYVNAETLYEFIGNVEFDTMNINTLNR